MSNIVIIQGSPRKDGNTARLVQAFREGVSSEHHVTIINVAELHINYCIGCNSCFTREGNRCFQQDDMQKIMPKLAAADVLVFASPVYFYGISAQLKTLLDRLHTPLRNTFKVKQTALLLVGAASLPELFDSIKTQYRLLRKFFQLRDLGTVLVRGVKEKGNIEGRPELQEARELGRSIGPGVQKYRKYSPKWFFQYCDCVVKSIGLRLTSDQENLMEWFWNQDIFFREMILRFISTSHDDAWKLSEELHHDKDVFPLLQKANIIEKYGIIDESFISNYEFSNGKIIPLKTTSHGNKEKMTQYIGWTYIQKRTSGGLFCELATAWLAQKAVERFKKSHPDIGCHVWHDIKLQRTNGNDLTDCDVLVRVGEHFYFIEVKASSKMAESFHTGQQGKAHEKLLKDTENCTLLYCIGIDDIDHPFSQDYILLERFSDEFYERLCKDAKQNKNATS